MADVSNTTSVAGYTKDLTKVVKATSPGILRPQFVVDGLAVKPDNIFDNLTDKQILD